MTRSIVRSNAGLLRRAPLIQLSLRLFANAMSVGKSLRFPEESCDLLKYSSRRLERLLMSTHRRWSATSCMVQPGQTVGSCHCSGVSDSSTSIKACRFAQNRWRVSNAGCENTLMSGRYQFVYDPSRRCQRGASQCSKAWSLAASSSKVTPRPGSVGRGKAAPSRTGIVGKRPAG